MNQFLHTDMIIPKHLELKKIPGKGKGLVSKKAISEGKMVLRFENGITLRPNITASPTAIQIDEDIFLDSKPTQIRDFLNHSCDANTRIDFDAMGCIAIKKINKGDEITFNYNTTEFDLKYKNESFTCNCGSKNCHTEIGGFKHLTKKQKNQIKPFLTAFLLRKFRDP